MIWVTGVVQHPSAMQLAGEEKTSRGCQREEAPAHLDMSPFFFGLDEEDKNGKCALKG